MPPEYIIRQMTYFKSGARSEETRMGPIARASSDEDVREAAAYFAAITPAPFVKVIEAATPPKTYVSADARHRRIHPDGGTEPIGRRIVQIPEDPMRTAIRMPYARSRSSLRTAIAARNSTAARSARRASSSCSVGIPNAAITASPMNFSTVPPWWARTASWRIRADARSTRRASPVRPQPMGRAA